MTPLNRVLDSPLLNAKFSQYLLAISAEF